MDVRRNLTDSERIELANKLDQDLDKFIQNAAKRQPTPLTNVEQLEKELNEHPAFISELPSDGSLPPLVEALQSLKYDTEENTAEELAQHYKEDGNYNFKLKNYRFAITSYSEGLKQRCQNNELNSQLHGNRAAAQFELKNYRQCLKDCEESINLQSNNLKVIKRAVNCCIQLKLIDQGLDYCTHALKQFPEDETIMQLLQDLKKQKKIVDRDERKKILLQKKDEDRNRNIWRVIQERKIRMAELLSKEIDFDNFPDIESLTSNQPTNCKIHLNDNCLIWPVIFMYPEFSQMDLIEKFNENTSFHDELNNMFGLTVPPAPWDRENVYKIKDLNVYFEDNTNNSLVCVSTNKTLLQILQHDKYIIHGGTPTFIILVNGSKFEKEFVARYHFIST